MQEPEPQDERPRPPGAAPWVALGLAVLGTAALLRGRGMAWACAADAGWPPWWGDAWSAHTSQHALDPYSFTHLLHGFVLGWVVTGIARGRLALPWLLFLVVAAEGGWELVENSPTVIERYRANTAALGYSGDAVLNSLGDLASCALGFGVSHRLGLRRALAVFVAVELALLAWIRDSLTLNVVMLVWPLEAVRLWQQG